MFSPDEEDTWRARRKVVDALRTESRRASSTGRCNADMYIAQTVVDNCERFRRSPEGAAGRKGGAYIAHGVVETDSVSRELDAMIVSLFWFSAIIALHSALSIAYIANKT